jgi:hypothetical protein
VVEAAVKIKWDKQPLESAVVQKLYQKLEEAVTNLVSQIPNDGHEALQDLSENNGRDEREARMRPLTLLQIPVQFLDGSVGVGRAEGTDAAWHCPCGDELPLIGRRAPRGPYITRCGCGKRYTVYGSDENPHTASRIEEID